MGFPKEKEREERLISVNRCRKGSMERAEPTRIEKSSEMTFIHPFAKGAKRETPSSASN